MDEFCVVKFPDESDAVAVVWKGWILGDKCYWPKFSKHITKLVKNKTEVDVESWEPCKVKLIHSFRKSNNISFQIYLNFTLCY